MAQGGSLAKLVLIAAVLVGATYALSWQLGLSETASIIWKGAGVGLLAFYAALLARTIDGWLIAAVLALGALGDVLLEASGLETGAAAFAIGHIIAIWLYLRNRRADPAASQRALALVVVILVPLLGWLLTGKGEVAFYSAILGTMAATAWLSRFPRYRTGIGAMMFVASDLLIFARMDILKGVEGVPFAIWLLYFMGQLLICIGVVGNAKKEPFR